MSTTDFLNMKSESHILYYAFRRRKQMNSWLQFNNTVQTARGDFPVLPSVL